MDKINAISRFTISFCIIVFSGLSVLGQSREYMVKVDGGSYTPSYGNRLESEKDKKVVLPSFYIDKYLVTITDYLNYLKSEPGEKWIRSQASKLFVDNDYLKNWEGDLQPGNTQPLQAAVTYVSWFAAKKYCNAQGKRLPTVDEWEYMAMASEVDAYGGNDEALKQKILNWYETPNTHQKKVGTGAPNYWGVYDVYERVWEWTSDFNAIIISGDSRKKGDLDNTLFCAGGAIGAADPLDYAAFARYAFRGSLKPTYAIKGLGFRCACDAMEN